MSKITTVAHVLDAVSDRRIATSDTSFDLVLPLDQYLSVLSDHYQARPTLTPAPNLSRLHLSWFNLTILPLSYCAKFQLFNHNAVLAEVARNAVFSVGYQELQVGPYRYALPFVNQVAGIGAWLGGGNSLPGISGGQPSTVPPPPPPSAGNFFWPYGKSIADTILDSTKSNPVLTEPPCNCDSYHLTVAGHEAGCRWMTWKSAGGEK